MLVIDADSIQTRVSALALVDALRRGHRTGDLGEVGRLLLRDPQARRTLLAWGGWRRDLGIAVKAATTFPDNAGAGRRPNIQSVVVLFDPDDGSPTAVIVGESFTRMKTAADSALGADFLAPPAPRRLALLGAGAQAEMQARFHLAVRPSLSEVVVWNRTPAAAERIVERLVQSGIDCWAVPDAREAVAEADVVTCVTASAAPVLRGEWLRPGCHIDLVGAYTPEMRESDDEVVRRGRLFADSRQFGISTCGDYAQPIASGVIGPQDILGDLFDLCCGRVDGRSRPDEITVFKNCGGGHLDLMIARALLAIHREVC